MTSQPRPIASHSRVRELLPWYANRTLAAGESREVEEHLEECPVCARELAGLERLAEAIRLESDPQGDPTAAFTRLAPRLDGGDREAVPKGGWWCRARGLLEATPVSVRAVLAAQLLLLTAALSWIAMTPAPPESLFRTLADPAAEVTPTDGWNVRVVFADGATAEQIGTALRAGGLRIIDGPGPGGAFTLRPTDEAGALPQVLERLRDDPVVALAEPVGPDPAVEEW